MSLFFCEIDLIQIIYQGRQQNMLDNVLRKKSTFKVTSLYVCLHSTLSKKSRKIKFCYFYVYGRATAKLCWLIIFCSTVDVDVDDHFGQFDIRWKPQRTQTRMYFVLGIAKKYFVSSSLQISYLKIKNLKHKILLFRYLW
jgi:hypothetical protein